MMHVQVTSQEILKPSLPTPDHLCYQQISIIDQLNAPFFVATIYFFKCPNNTTLCERSTFLQKLKTSLPHTLSIYYPLAGRLYNANNVVCNDEGVLYLHAEVRSTSMTDIVRKAQISDLDPLTPSLEQKGFSRILLAIQVNSFSCGGVAIGVKFNHRITDGFSFRMFLNAWTDITNGKDPNLIPRPYFNTAKLFPPIFNPADMLDEPNPHVLIDKSVAKWFMFTRESLDLLRAKLFSSENVKSVPSVATVLSAFIWSRITLASNNNSINSNITYETFVSVDIRQKVNGPSKNSFYYGNMMVNATAKPTCTLKSGESLCCDYIERVQDSITNIQNENFINKIKEGKQDLRFVTDQFDRVKKGEIKVLGFSNVSNVAIPLPDFGWGNPVWVMPGTMIDGLVLIRRDGQYSKDVVATINLNKDDMAKLEADEVFNSLVYERASTLTSGSKL